MSARIKIRRWKVPYPQRREVTARRLAAAEKALRMERERMPLFSEQVAQEQPTAEERIDAFDQGAFERALMDRKRIADRWRRIREKMRAMPRDQWWRLVRAWNNSGCPADSLYLSEFIGRWPTIQAELGSDLSLVELLAKSILVNRRGGIVPAAELADHLRMACHDLTRRGLAVRHDLPNNTLGWSLAS